MLKRGLAAAVAAGTAALLLVNGSSNPRPDHAAQPDRAASQPSHAEASPDKNKKPAVTLPAHGPYIGPDVAQRQQDFKNPALSAKENMEFGLFDPEQLKRDGVSYEIAKASQGLTYVDGYFAENRKRAEEAGLLFGAYHFLVAGNGAAQADFFYEQLEKTGGPEGTMMMVDVESKDDNDDADGPAYEDVTDFTERLRELVPDREIILYTLSMYWGSEAREGQLGNPPAPEGTVLNWASYIDEKAPIHVLADKVAAPGSPSDPYIDHQVGTYKSYFFRQYTSTAVYDQYQGQHLDDPNAGQSTVDMNIYFGPPEALLKLAGRAPDGTIEAAE